MEKELQRQALDGFQLIFSAPLSQEETLECIVPDALPDVAQIIGASGRVEWKGRQVGDGALRLSGTVAVTVLYLPEGEQTPRAMEVELPFQCGRDDPKLREGGIVHASIQVSWADAKALNPRKLLVRANLVCQARVYARQRREYTCGVSGGEGDGLEKQFVQRVDHAPCQVLEQPFLFSDVLRPPASRPEMEQLLCCRARLGAAEAKAIGKKLVCKGEVHLSALYRSGGSVLAAGFEMPFSQIFELERAGDESEIQLDVQITALRAGLQDGELAVSVEALAQAVVWEARPVTLLADAYCTSEALDVERTPCELCTGAQRGERREQARQFCPSAQSAQQVLECCAVVESMEADQEEGGMRCTAQLRVQVLCLGEDGGLFEASYLLPAQCEIPLPAGGVCRWQCAPAGEATAVPVTGGLEVRCEALFSWLTTQGESVPCVTALRPGPAPAEQGPRPSLTIRMVGQGESLWDVAKACGSTVQDICQANGLPDGELAQGAVLLIPTRR